ncbi:MAG TPA: DUF4350 domain-containing protein [Candidatus Dormibacteraeota bacterium]|nr:DUF4350 domain-containing protein [Candidatus Dormibacteraeota bacterium]
MRGARGWLLAGLAAVIVAAIAYYGQPQQDSPDHSSSSDAANGTSAARLFAQAMGHPTDQVAGTFKLPASPGLMFVFTPTSPYTFGEAQRALQWVRSGGTLVYGSEQGDPQLDHELGVVRLGGFVASGNQLGNPVLAGVGQVAGGASVDPLDPSAEQVPILRTPQGLATAYVQTIGSGTVIVLADPLVLCNGYLEKQDNGRFLADLLGVTGPGAPVTFDEYHHGVVLSDFAPQAWVTTPWGAAMLWLLVAVFVGLVLRGRNFGPLIPRPADAGRSDAEWSVAVGQLLRRSSARALTLGLLASATERAVASRTGLPLQPRERFWNALWVRAPELAAELAEAENTLHSSSATEADLLSAAQRLHRIAHPVPGALPRGRSKGAA